MCICGRVLSVCRAGPDGPAPHEGLGCNLDGGAAEGWAALGRALANLPHLEHLDLSYTHGMTYVDPARGAARTAFPPLRALRRLVLAHDLAVESTPKPRDQRGDDDSDGSGLDGWHCGSQGGKASAATSASGETSTRRWIEAPEGLVTRRAELAASEGGTDGQMQPHIDWYEEPTLAAEGEAGEGEGEAHTGGEDGLGYAMLAALDLEAGAEFLAVEAPLASVELLTWLPGCGEIRDLDLSYCGLEAPPLALAQLPHLARLDLRVSGSPAGGRESCCSELGIPMPAPRRPACSVRAHGHSGAHMRRPVLPHGLPQGNPLTSLRFPGPLPSLTILCFSLDDRYERRAELLAAEVGNTPLCVEQ